MTSLMERNSTTYEASGLPATVVIGGRDVAHVLPNLNASFQCGTGAERYWLNLNRTGAPACAAIADEPTTNGIITEVGDAFSFDAQGRLKWDVVFAAHPGVYAWEWSAKHSPGVTFHYQPALTAEEIAEGHIRPADVVGSYAVYGDRSGLFIDRDGTVLADYGTGKLCHIYRPLFIDADGREEYGTLDIADGIMTVSMDAAWMDAATYPVRLDPTIGYEATGASAIPLANSQHANWAFDEVVADDITLQSGHIYCGSLSGGVGSFRVGLYSKGATVAASSLLASSDSISLASGSDFVWRSAPLSGSIAAGTPLVISCLETNTDGSVRSQYDTVSWGSGKSGSNATGAMFATLSGLSDNSRQLSMYVTYEVASAAEPIQGDISFPMPSPYFEASGAYISPVVGQLGIDPQLPTVAAEGQVLTPVAGSISISAPFPSVSITGTYTPPEEVDPDTVYGSIAFMAPFPSMEISGNVIAPVMGSVSASPSSPALSLSGDVLQPILGTVSADAPAPELEASGATPSVIYGDMSLDIDWLPVFALAGYVIDDSEQSATAKSAYSGIAANALRMIKSKGVAMTLRVVTAEGAYVPGSGTPAQTTTDYTVYGVLTNPFVSQKQTFFSNSLIQSNDRVVLMGAGNGDPSPGDIMIIGGAQWAVVSVIPIAPDGTPIIYKVQIRRG